VPEAESRTKKRAQEKEEHKSKERKMKKLIFPGNIAPLVL
jgi:hypothetical protein